MWIDAGAYSYNNGTSYREEREARESAREARIAAREAEAEAVAKAEDNDPLWGRLLANGYTVRYEMHGGEAYFDVASKVVRKATRTARRDHRDGKIKAGQRYVEVTTRFVNHEGHKWHTIGKRVIG